MKKSNLKLVIDGLMFLFIALMAGLGLLIKFVLVPGEKRWELYGRNVDLSFLGLDRHQWGTIHLIIAVLFVLALVLHVSLSWKILVSWFRKSIRVKGMYDLAGVSFFIVLFFLIVFPFFIVPKVEELGDGRYRFLNDETVGLSPIEKNVVSPETLSGSETDQTGVSVAGTSIADKKDIETKTTNKKVSEAGIRNDKSSDKVATVKPTVITQPEHHDIDPDIEVLGSMTFSEVSRRYDVPMNHIITEMKLPATISGREQIGRLRRTYGFKMSDIEMIIYKYRKKNEKN